MKHLLTALAAVLLLTACARADNAAAVGQHNLSKGKCRHIDINGKIYHESMTLNQCRMLGGTFTPRNRKGYIWF